MNDRSVLRMAHNRILEADQMRRDAAARRDSVSEIVADALHNLAQFTYLRASFRTNNPST